MRRAVNSFQCFQCSQRVGGIALDQHDLAGFDGYIRARADSGLWIVLVGGRPCVAQSTKQGRLADRRRRRRRLNSVTHAEATRSQDLASWLAAHVRALEFDGRAVRACGLAISIARWLWPTTPKYMKPAAARDTAATSPAILTHVSRSVLWCVAKRVAPVHGNGISAYRNGLGSTRQQAGFDGGSGSPLMLRETS